MNRPINAGITKGQVLSSFTSIQNCFWKGGKKGFAEKKIHDEEFYRSFFLSFSNIWELEKKILLCKTVQGYCITRF